MTAAPTEPSPLEPERRRDLLRANWIYIPLIIGLIVLSIVLWDSGPELFTPQDQVPAPTFEEYPYAVIEAAKSQHFNEDGQLSYTLEAALLRHFRKHMSKPSANDYMLLDTLELTMYSEGKPWVLQAKQGRLSENGSTLSLWDEVRISQSSENGALTELTTTHLTVKPRDKMIMTDAPIKITNPQGQIEAVGMVVNVKEEKINLLSEVRAQHVPI